MGVECWLLCVVRRMFGAQVCRVVRWLFGFGVVGLLVVLIVPLLLSFLAMPGLCCFLRVTPESRTQFNKRRTKQIKLKQKLKHEFFQKQAQDVSTKFKEGEPKKLAWNAIKSLHGLLTGKSAKQTNHTPTVVLQGETTNDPQAACTVFAAHYETLGNEQPSENFCAETTNTVTSALKSWREGAPQVIESCDSAFTIDELTFALKSMPMWKAGLREGRAGGLRGGRGGGLRGGRARSRGRGGMHGLGRVRGVDEG